jgi:hypothetical protein
MATRAKKSAASKPAASKPAATKSASTKPKSNFCEDHGRLLRADRTCPVSTCRFHAQPMP